MSKETTVMSTWTGIDGTEGSYKVEVIPDGSPSVKNPFMVPDGNYEVKFVVDGKTVTKKVTIYDPDRSMRTTK